MTTRTLTVDRSEAGWTVQEWLRVRLKMSRSAAGRLVQGRKVRLSGNVCTQPIRQHASQAQCTYHLYSLPLSVSYMFPAS